MMAKAGKHIVQLPTLHKKLTASVDSELDRIEQACCSGVSLIKRVSVSADENMYRGKGKRNLAQPERN